MAVDPNHQMRLLLGLIPADVRKAISDDELADRVAESARLSAQASDPSLSADLRQGARIRAQMILKAQPRDTTLTRRAQLIAKAAAAPNREHADVLRRQAEALEEQHPVAPRRGAQVAKAAAKPATPDLVPVYDQDGMLVGVADSAEITPVRGSKPSPTPEENAQDGALAENVAKACGMVAVYDQGGRPYLTYQRNILKSAPLQTSAEQHARFERKASGCPQPGDTDGDDHGHGSTGTPAEVQARRGSVRDGGTTGLGQPRMTGPAASLPGDGPQQVRPGDAAGRTVVKGAGWIDVHDYRGVPVGIVKQSDLITAPSAVLDQALKRTGRADALANVYDTGRRRVGIALLSDILPVRPGR